MPNLHFLIGKYIFSYYYIEQDTYKLIMLSVVAKKNSIKNALKWQFSGFSFFFIAMLFFVVVHDGLTGDSSQTSEYCTKYGFLASPECW
jgi:hypothetical protein